VNPLTGAVDATRCGRSRFHFHDHNPFCYLIYLADVLFFFSPSMLSERNYLARRIFKDLPSRYDRLAEILSLGQNRRWQMAMLQPVLAATPSRCLDLATGTASVAIKLASRARRRGESMHDGAAPVVAIDLSPAMVSVGRQRAAAAGADVIFGIARAEQLPFRDNTFDTLTFTYLLRYVEDPAETLKEIVRVLRPDGVISSVEFFVPQNPVFRFGWMIYTRIVLPALGRIFGREWYEVGRFLEPSISDHYRRFPLRQQLRAWQDAGISSPRYRVMSLGAGLVMWGIKH
jgi:demethylmenaquinone methyltransferase/2-methoxy-6-polyprenyl-1,4-benzoquinol methylase